MNEKEPVRWAIIVGVLFASVIIGIFTACSYDSARPVSPGWHHKALASARDAERLVGGFDASERALYKNGIRHILNVRGRVGGYTIGQVIADERQRAQVRANAAGIERQVAVARESSRLDDKATDNLMSVMRLANETLNYQLYHGGKVSGTNCIVQIDADHYEFTSAQDKDIIKETVATMCKGAYVALGGQDQRRIPADGLHIEMVDLAKNSLYSDTLVPR